ncbi:hypothetical protein EIB75_09475 [Epilithonimonas vandammei]|uniref:Uncharacterized protein n=1 Tax=Epilithonimonas vandammei TaxID=2487072 RepID=A0A3G8ZNR5_9FLAO|nr:DUF6266 family protein [Epilithonimonas vandammei]AZI40012.1 hypothetical protein EIB74_08585 [Epilithonimonas vandammei]AZI55461.1 hypothetical protein EIB75_09475 [Epilithonimonas vandammei]
MATLSKGILGGFSGKVGPVVGATWRGMDVIRSRPKSSKRTPSEKQLEQQLKFKLAISFLQPIKNIQSRFFGSGSGVKSRVNLAVSYTISEAIQMVAGLPELIYNKVLITRGELTSFQNAVLTTQPGGVLHLEWEDNSTQGDAAPKDQVSIVCYCAELNNWEIYEGIVMRSDLMADVTLPAYCLGKTMEVYAFLNNEKQTAASTSLYLGQHVVN